MKRRDFLKFGSAVAISAAIPFAEWEPTKLISIPSGKVFTGENFWVAPDGNIHWVGTPDGRSKVIDLYRFLHAQWDERDKRHGDDLLDITSQNPAMRITDNIIELADGFRINSDTARHLYGGTIRQTDTDGNRDDWFSVVSIGNVDPDVPFTINGRKCTEHVDMLLPESG